VCDLGVWSNKGDKDTLHLVCIFLCSRPRGWLPRMVFPPPPTPRPCGRYPPCPPSIPLAPCFEAASLGFDAPRCNPRALSCTVLYPLSTIHCRGLSPVHRHKIEPNPLVSYPQTPSRLVPAPAHVCMYCTSIRARCIFYAAWPNIQKITPSVPSHPILGIHALITCSTQTGTLETRRPLTAFSSAAHDTRLWTSTSLRKPTTTALHLVGLCQSVPTPINQ
jgi:hypothetical protein